MQSETGFPSSRQFKSYVASKSRLKLAARAVVSADAGLLVHLVMKVSKIYSLELHLWKLWQFWSRGQGSRRRTTHIVMDTC